MSARRLKLVITELNFGGAEQRLVDLALHVDRTRFEPAVISLGPRPHPPATPRTNADQQAVGEDHLVQRLESAGVPVTFLDAAGTLSAAAVAHRLRQQLRKDRCDLVQSFLFHANVACGLVRSKQVQHFAGIRVADPRRWRLWVERRAVRKARKIICVSNSVADHLLAHRFAPQQLVTIPNAVDAARLSAATTADWGADGIDGDGPIVAVVGRLDPQKGTDWLLQQIPQIATRWSTIQFVFAGRGNAAAYAQVADRLGVSQRVHFLGWRGDVAGILKRSDLLLLPSRWEGMPNVVLEAMALGVPVLATPTHGVMELLGPLAGPMTFDMENSDQLAAGLERWLSRQRDPNLDDAITQLQRRAVEEFSIESMVRRYERVWGD